MSFLKQLTDLGDVKGKTVLLRADLDCAIVNGEVSENYRLKKASKTIKYLSESGAKVIIIGHLGRPGGKYNDALSLMPVRFELGKLLNSHIKFAHIPNCRNSVRYMEPGEILMLENVRFHEAEESDDIQLINEFFGDLIELCDMYVNDAFSAYRTSASTYYIPKSFELTAAGYQLVDEIEKLSKFKESKDVPYVAIVGGAKLDTKVKILEKLVTEADHILIGGAMAYTFLRAKDLKTGNSKVDDSQIDVAKNILQKAVDNKCGIHLPVDHICGNTFDSKTERSEISNQEIPDDLVGLDIGGNTIVEYRNIIKTAGRILWNGPMGVFEWDNFMEGTESIGEAIALNADNATFKVAGGIETVAAIEKSRINMKNFTHVSTGGGAMLAFLSGEKMPTLEILTK